VLTLRQDITGSHPVEGPSLTTDQGQWGRGQGSVVQFSRQGLGPRRRGDLETKSKEENHGIGRKRCRGSRRKVSAAPVPQPWAASPPRTAVDMMNNPGVAEVSLSRTVTARQKPWRINLTRPGRSTRQGRDLNRNRGQRNLGEEWRPSKATGTLTAAVKQPPTEGPESVTGSARETALGGLL
jgi:hypothetical protein